MRISIAQKLRPFSHLPGTRCLIPYTTWEAEIFPAKIFFRCLASGERKEETLAVEGPVKGFTVVQDLERGRVEVFGRGAKGYFRYFLDPATYPFLKMHALKPSHKRLSLGIHKKQDWDLIKRRDSMAEVFPFWLRLAHLIPEIPLPKAPVGTLSLLQEGKLELTFKAAFQGILSPRLRDENYLGLIPDVELPNDLSPIGLLYEGARQIEALFFQQEGEEWHFLPQLPKEFHAGRFLHLQTEEGDEIDLEWSKKSLKKMIVRPKASRPISLQLQKGLKSFRLRTNPRQRGERKEKELILQEGQVLFLDRFMK